MIILKNIILYKKPNILIIILYKINIFSFKAVESIYSIINQYQKNTVISYIFLFNTPFNKCFIFKKII